MSATGRCLCGAVSYTAEDVQPHMHTCHCSMCRRWSGGPAFAATVGSVEFEGEQHIRRYDSSEWGARGFCSQCGSNLFFHVKPMDQYVMWAGTFDDSAGLSLTQEIYIDQKPDGYAFAGDHPRLTEKEFLASIGQAQE